MEMPGETHLARNFFVRPMCTMPSSPALGKCRLVVDPAVQMHMSLRMPSSPCRGKWQALALPTLEADGALCVQAEKKARKGKGKEEESKYSKTVNLPVTDFNQRANAVKREPEIQKFW